MPGLAPAPGPGLRGHTPMVALLSGILLMSILVKTATAASVHSQPASLCPAGSYFWEEKSCQLCKEGVDYTKYPNILAACIPCTICGKDKDEKSPCTVTSDTVCQCKPETYQDKDSPEICLKCRSSCPNGTEERPCTPWSNRECIHKEAGISVTRETPASGEPATTNLRTPASSSFNVILVVFLAILGLIVIVGLVLLKYFCSRRKNSSIKANCSGPDRNLVDRVSWPPWAGVIKNCFQPQHEVRSWCLSISRGSEAQDNNCNELLTNGRSTSTLDSEQEGERHQLMAETPEQSPGEARCLPAQAAKEGSPTKRRKLIPVEGTDPIESIKMCFNSSEFVPYESWYKLMRMVGLTDNDIELVKADTRIENDVLYKMVEKWTNKMGRGASINTLLGALETLGERRARERIEEYMVKHGKFTYEEDKTDPPVPLE